MRSGQISFVVLLSVCLQTLAAEPATRPAADPAYRIGEVDVQTVSAYTYAWVSARTTLADLKNTIATLMPKFEAAVRKGDVHPSGAMVFTYIGASGDPNQEFELRIGAFINRPVAAGAGVTVSDEPALKCATLIYRGSLANLKEAFGVLYGAVYARGLTPAPVSRELYLYWEGPDSPNNIIQLQVGVK